MSTRTPGEPADDRTDSDRRPIHVLHVDDDPAFTELTAAYLPVESSRIVVTSATNVDDALAHLETRHVDCVVSDYDMPRTNGLTFLLRVRERWPDLPFVLFTGKGSEEVAADAISTGVSDYLQKGGTDRYALLATRVTTHVEKYWMAQELATMRRRYALVGTVAADAFFEWDVRTDTVWRSEGYARVFRYDEAAVDDSFDWWRDRLHPDDRERVLHRLESTLSAGDARFEETFRFRLGDGSYANVAARAHVEYTDEPTTVTGALTDLTRYVEQERQLEHARTRLELALEGTETGVWEWDMETDEVTWDRTTERLFGPDGGTFDGTKDAYLACVHPDDVSHVEATIQQAITADEMYEVEHRLRAAADGTIRWVNGWGVVVTRAGIPSRLVGVVRDITERHEVHDRLQRQNERLQEFASVVSHDLRGPLSVAMGHLDLVKPADDASRTHLETVRRTHDRMEVLLTDLLSLARQGVTIYDPEPVSLTAVATTAWEMVDHGDATLVVTDDLRFSADERRLQQALENLFRNAVEHGSTSSRPETGDSAEQSSTDSRPRADDGTQHDSATPRRVSSPSDEGVTDDAVHSGPPLTVTVGPCSTGSGPGFFVADDGAGIDSRDRDRVFDPGYTASSVGTGFGLAIVARIAEAHGWEVTVTDSETGGARFEFSGVEPVDD